ncbi:MAG: DUF4065 domain-containing protein [Lachnospiraceae bacterium]|nr:DUF4065 domain-containing protein [Lachnospiraceae bacterium]
MYNVMDVARYVVNYSIEIGRPVSNLKLQKLLYFIQVAFISQYGLPCYEEPIIHWRHGPVVESVYQKYKAYGAENITDKELEYFSFSFNVDTRSFMIEPKKYNESVFEFSHLMLIRSIIESYKDTSPWEMVDLTHKEEPWKRTDRNEEITVNMIKQCYS